MQNLFRFSLIQVLYRRVSIFFYAFNGYLSVRDFTICIACSLFALSLIMSEIASAIGSMSSSFISLDVTAAVPRRTPLITNGDFSV